MVQVNSDQNRTNSTVGQRYRLLRRIREPASSTELWEAFDGRLERPVTLRLLAQHARDDRQAQDRLRQAARAPLVNSRPGAQRVLDGGEDPVYGPFVVAELGSASEATQPLLVADAVRPEEAASDGVRAPLAGATASVVAQPRPARPARPERERRSGFGVLALGAMVVVAAALVVLARTFASPAAAPAQPSVPPATARPTAPPAAPTPAQATQPTPLAPTPRPTVQPTAQPAAPTPAAQPTAQPAAPTAPAVPTQPPVPAAPAAALAAPVATIRQHYALIDARRYADGYALMDAHLRSLNSPADYAGWFANKISIKPVSVDLVSQTDSEAVVRSVVSTTDRVNGQNVTSQVAEQFILHNEGGAWRIDQVTRV